MVHSSVASVSDAAFLGKTESLRAKLHDVLTTLDRLPAVGRSAEVRPCALGEQSVRAILRARRTRDEFFSDDLFGDPAWDILLELYAAQLGQRRIAISSLCVGAAVPATTALRWIGILEEKGLVFRQHDPFDGRRVFASLSETGYRSIEAYFAALPNDVLPL